MRPASESGKAENMIAVALKLAEIHGYHRVTAKMIATELAIAYSLVPLRLGRVERMREAIMRQAIVERRLVVLAQGVALKDPVACSAPDDIQREAMAYLAP